MRKEIGLILSVAFLLGSPGQAYEVYSQEGSLSNYQSPQWSSDGMRIVFSASDDTKNVDIYVTDSSYSHLKRLTDDPARDAYPAISPDGRKIVFASYRGPEKQSQIYLMEKDGSNVVQLTHGSEGNSFPRWSPDGKRIVFMSKRGGTKWQIYVMDRNGSDQRRLTHNSTNDFNPVFSPNGKEILFESDRDGGKLDEIYVMNADGSDQKRLTVNNDNDENDIFPVWIGNGKDIGFSTIKDRKSNIFRMKKDGTGKSLVIKDAAFAAWSPDGKKLVYVSAEAGKPSHIFLSDADGSNPKKLFE